MPCSVRTFMAFVGAVIALVLATYGGALSHPFLPSHDDLLYVTQNPAVTGGWRELAGAWTRFHVGNWAPLHILSYAADYALFGPRPAWFILENLVLHAANSILVGVLVLRLGGPWAAAVVAAAVFAVHPVQVESVIWISQMKNVLAMTFLSTAHHCYLLEDSSLARRRLWRALSLFATAAALLTKSVAVVLPFALLLLDAARGRARSAAQAVVDKLPFLALAAGTAIVAVVSQSSEAGGGRAPYPGGSPLSAFLTMATVLPRYLANVSWPSTLSAAYSPAIRAGFDGTVAAALVLAFALLLAGVLLRRRQPRLLLWYTLFFLGLLPVSQIIPLVTLMNDRYLYFPMIGASALVGEGVAHGLRRLDGAPRRALIAASAMGLALLAYTAHARTKVWRSDLALWSDAVGKEPQAGHAWYNLGRAQEATGAFGDALTSYERSIQIEPDAADALVNAAAMHIRLGSPGEAARLLDRAVRFPRAPYEAWFNLALARYQMGEPELAKEPLARALALEPTWCEAHQLRVELARLRGAKDVAEAQAAALRLGCRWSIATSATSQE